MFNLWLRCVAAGHRFENRATVEWLRWSKAKDVYDCGGDIYVRRRQFIVHPVSEVRTRRDERIVQIEWAERPMRRLVWIRTGAGVNHATCAAGVRVIAPAKRHQNVRTRIDVDVHERHRECARRRFTRED